MWPFRRRNKQADAVVTRKGGGQGKYEGINYTYKTCSDSRFGTYTCSVDKCFLDGSGKRLKTEDFQLAGHTWYVVFVNRNDGDLGAYLYSMNFPAVKVHYTFTVVNHLDEKKNKSWGDARKLIFHEDGGCYDLPFIAQIKDEASGFLKSDAFVVRLEIRIKLPGNEVCELCTEKDSSVYTWKIKDLYGRSPWIMTTEKFEVGGCKWLLFAYPYGEKRDVKHLGFYLVSLNDSNVTATCTLIAINCQSSEKNISWKIGEQTFKRYNDSKGFPEFLPTEALKDASLGFLEDGWITLTTKIEVLNRIDDKASSSLSCSTYISWTSQTNKMLTQQDVGTILPGTIETLDAKTVENLADSHAIKEDENLTSQTTANKTEEKDSKSLETKGEDYNELNMLEPGSTFASKYVMESERVQGKPYIRFAVNQLSGQAVVLKFYSSREQFQRSLHLSKQLSAQYVCKAIDCIDDDRLGVLPCLVYERGNCTLDKWIENIPAEVFKRKAVLFDVLQCLKHLHDHNIVHCDIKPSNIMFFPSSHSWKLLDTDLSVKCGEPYQIHYTLMYATPEVVQAEERGQTTIVPEPHVDMFGFGVLAYEVLTGNRFYGLSATEDTVKDCLCGRRDLPSLESVEEPAARRLISNLLCKEPRDRWSAQRALNHAVFKCAEDTTQRATGMQQVNSQLKQILSITQSTANEIRAANLMVDILADGFCTNADASVPFHQRDVQEVPMMSDEYLKNKGPVFLLNLGKQYRLRLALKHRFRSQTSFQKIRSVTLMPPDGPRVNLCIEEVPSALWEHEVVTLFDPKACGSQRLTSISPSFGNLREKYVMLDVFIELETEGQESHILELRGEIYCKMVAENDLLILRRAAMSVANRWKKAPQWIRDGARGAVIFAKEIAPVVPAATIGDPSVILFAVRGIKRIFGR